MKKLIFFLLLIFVSVGNGIAQTAADFYNNGNEKFYRNDFQASDKSSNH